MVTNGVSTREGMAAAWKETRNRPIPWLSLLLLLMVSVFLTSDTRLNSANATRTYDNDNTKLLINESARVENGSGSTCRKNGWNASVEWDVQTPTSQSLPTFGAGPFVRFGKTGSRVASDPEEDSSFSPSAPL